MRECLFTELKTLFYSKYIYIGILFLVAFSTFFNVSNYKNAIDSIEYNKDIYEELQMLEEEIDDSSLIEIFSEYYETYHPNMTANIVLSVLIGLGILVFPILSSIYVGSDYGKSNMIRNKICHYSLTRVLICKIICIVITIFITLLLYLGTSFIVTYTMWPKFESILHGLPLQIPSVTFNSMNFIIQFIVTFAIFTFYSLVAVGVTALFKNSIGGIIITIAVNYFFLPFEFAPHNVIYALLNKFFTFTAVSPAVFTSNFSQPNLGTLENICLFVLYFVILMASCVLIGKKQRN